MAGLTNDTLRIRGGKPLKGEVEIRGAKNSVPKIMVATLLTDQPCVINNVPDIQDVRIVSQMISLLGGEVVDLDHGRLQITNANLKMANHEKLRSVDKKSRLPILFAGPLLARLGRASVPELGGCEIGARPVNFHLGALEELGANVAKVERGYLLEARRLRGSRIRLEYPSVGATEQVLLASVLAEGVTELSNAAMEPEIMDLIAVLQKMGAIISVDTDRSITILGVDKLGGFEHTVIPDRLEAASWACAAILTGGVIFVKHARQDHLTIFLNKLRQIGGGFKITDEGILFWRESDDLRPIVLETNVWPGFSTDWQQPFTTLLTQAGGVSVVHETVYENRFGYVSELNRMGARIQIHRECLGGLTCRFGKMNHFHSAIVSGPSKLKSADIVVPDLRAGFSYVIAALAATGVSNIKNIGTIERGYENFTDKLLKLGADLG